MIKTAQRLLDKVGDSITATLDHYNQNAEKGFIKSTFLLLDNSVKKLSGDIRTLPRKLRSALPERVLFIPINPSPSPNGKEEAVSHRKERVEVKVEPEPVVPSEAKAEVAAVAPPPPVATTVEAAPVEPGEEVVEAPADMTLTSDELYRHGLRDLAEAVGLTQPKCSAVLWYLELNHSPEYSHEVNAGTSRATRRYSDNAVTRLKAALPTLNMDEVWQAYKAADNGKLPPTT